MGDLLKLLTVFPFAVSQLIGALIDGLGEVSSLSEQFSRAGEVYDGRDATWTGRRFAITEVGEYSPAEVNGIQTFPPFRSRRSSDDTDALLLEWRSRSIRLKDRLLFVHLWRSSDVRNADTIRLMEDVVAQMKKELSGAVATISVHCAKFDQESDLATIRHASEELRLRHVVAADTDLRLWKSVGAEQWPTILILSPNEHRVLVALTGQSYSFMRTKEWNETKSTM